MLLFKNKRENLKIKSNYWKIYYRKNRDKILKRNKKWRDSHKEQMKKTRASWTIKNTGYAKKYSSKYRKMHKIQKKEYTENNFKSWGKIIPKKSRCQICRQMIYFNIKKRQKAIHFDHRNNGKEKIKGSPTSWMLGTKRTPKNEKIFKSCDFGILCSICNHRLPTKNRMKWLKNALAYTKGERE